MEDIYISGTGVWTPPHKISNDELVESFNKYVDLFNAENACLLYTSPSPRDKRQSRMPSSA